MIITALLLAYAGHQSNPKPVYQDATAPIEARVEDLLGRLTLEEKISFVHADSKFTTAPIPRLGIPRRWMSDGPQGVREDIGPDTWDPAGRTDDFATCMPAQICLAASWDPEMAEAFGDVIGEEARARGKNIMLGPGLNIMRTPLNGRNFEYYGEDPFLAGRTAVGYIKAVQSHDVASCVKHFACNNQETNRGRIDVEVDERTLREIYLPAFKAAVQEGGAWALMGSYNLLRGVHCCESDLLLNKILKDEWGFKGLVMTDWGGCHDTKEAVFGGLDLEMGSNGPYDGYYLAKPFRDGVGAGTYPMALLDDKVRRNLRVMFATHVLDGQKPGSFDTPAHQTAARKVAEAGMVLLKNEGKTLPLDVDKVKTIAVIGDNATRLQCRGGGSAGIKALYEITPLEGILKRVGGKANVTYSQGYGMNLPPDAVDRAVAAAKAADVVLVVAGLSHGRGGDAEGTDRRSLDLPFSQNELIARVVEANPRTIVVLIAGAPVTMEPWLRKVPAVLQAWYPGMEGGNALANVIFGDVNPSGKLPCTYPRRLEDSAAHAVGAYPGANGVETYSEGLLVGYRWFDAKKIKPLFPFGFGLSYTHFAYSNLRVAPAASGIDVEFDLANSGDRDGAEVTEVYVSETAPKLMRPPKELKGFAKVALKAGEKQTVTVHLGPEAFAYYDPDRKSWVADAGEFSVLVGGSSASLPLHGVVTRKVETLLR
jgi:beta-glucosidase